MCFVLYYSVVWCTVVWCTVVWCSVVWCSVVYCSVVWCSVVYCIVVYVMNEWNRRISIVLWWKPTQQTNMCLILCDVMWCYMMLCDVIWCYMMLCDVMWCYMMSCDVIWCYMMLCDVIWCYMMLCDVMWCYMMLWQDEDDGWACGGTGHWARRVGECASLASGLGQLCGGDHEVNSTVQWQGTSCFMIHVYTAVLDIQNKHLT